MSISLVSLSVGDTTYIDELNSNFAQIQAAINAMGSGGGTTGGGGGGSSVDFTHFMQGLIGNVLCLIGSGYAASGSGVTLTITAGDVWIPGATTVAQLVADAHLDFTTSTIGTYYVIVDPTGAVSLSGTTSPNALYSVVWNGASPLSGFGAITRLASRLTVTLT